LRLRDKEKNSEQKKKIPFSDLRFFAYRRRKRRREEGEKKRSAIHSPANSNLTGESIAREEERVLLFINRENTPSFTKSNTGNQKAKKKHNTQKII